MATSRRVRWLLLVRKRNGMSRSTLEGFTGGQPLGFDDLVLHLLESGARVDAYPFDGYWLDIGRPEDYEQANADYPRLR